MFSQARTRTCVAMNNSYNILRLNAPGSSPNSNISENPIPRGTMLLLCEPCYWPWPRLAALAQSPPDTLQAPWEGVPDELPQAAHRQTERPGDTHPVELAASQVKSIVLNSLGEMPPRPSPSAVKIVSVDRKNGYRIEKFEFHNGVDSVVPGYIAIPEDGKPRHPAILTMHGHSSSKENMFGYEPTSQNVAELLARQGYVVLGIDNYFNGERKGKGPAGQSRNDAARLGPGTVAVQAQPVARPHPVGHDAARRVDRPRLPGLAARGRPRSASARRA